MLVAQGVLVFMLAVAVDAFYVWWTLSANNGRAYQAAHAAFWIQICGVMGTLAMVMSPWLLVCNAFGHALGSFGAVRWMNAVGNRGVT